MDDIFAKEPTTDSSSFGTKVPSDASRGDLNQTALLDPGTKQLWVLLQALVSFRMRKDASDSLPVKLINQSPQGKNLVVRELYQEMDLAIRQGEHLSAFQ